MEKEPKKYLFYLGHPAHFHNVKIMAFRLVAQGDEVVYIARKKDVLFRLLDDCPHPIHFLSREKKKGKLGLIMFILYRLWSMFWIVRKEKPQVIIGTDVVITIIGKILGIPSVILNEDDLDQVPLLRLGLKWCTFSLAPQVCRYGDFEYKKIGYNGYQELAYLHPTVFEPQRSVIRSFHNSDRPYFILRFAELTAHHDKGRSGLSDADAQELIEILEPHGSVYITSERGFSKTLEPYRISVDPRDMHHALAFAHLYLGDSQTMAAEAAVLGTPSIRFNDFVGKLSYLEDLEHRFGLTKGVKTDRLDELFSIVRSWSSEALLRDQWAIKRQTMLTDCAEVNSIWLKAIEGCS